MIRRIAASAAAAVALILVPSAAMAYAPPGFSATVTDATPAAGAPFSVNMSGGRANLAITLAITSKNKTISNHGITIAGTKSFTRLTNASSEVAFKVTLTESGVYTLVLTNPEGVVRGTQTVTVHNAGAASGKSAGASAGTPSATELSRTGFDVMPWAAGGGLLVLVGAGAVLVARRRKSAQVSA
ncbi:MAG: hypothetical protein ACOH1Y_17030 [Propionicimonas sp.]